MSHWSNNHVLHIIWQHIMDHIAFPNSFSELVHFLYLAAYNVLHHTLPSLKQFCKIMAPKTCTAETTIERMLGYIRNYKLRPSSVKLWLTSESQFVILLFCFKKKYAVSKFTFFYLKRSFMISPPFHELWLS